MVLEGHFCNSDLHLSKKAMSHQETFFGGTSLLYIHGRMPVKRFLQGVIVIFGICVAETGTVLVGQ